MLHPYLDFNLSVVPQILYVRAANVLIACLQARYAFAPIAIGLSPVGFLTGTFVLASFGWFVTINTLLTIFLQEPEKKGGYGFTPQQNAACKCPISDPTIIGFD